LYLENKDVCSASGVYRSEDTSFKSAYTFRASITDTVNSSAKGAMEAKIDCPSEKDRPLKTAAAPTARRSNRPRPNTMGINNPPLNRPPLDAPFFDGAPYPGDGALLLATG
jgi:hypothetical protein